MNTWPPYWPEFTPTIGAFYWVKLYPQSPWLPAELRHGSAYGYHFKVFGEFSITAPDRVFAVWKEPIVKPPPSGEYEATYR